MPENVKIWLIAMYEAEIEETRVNISNNRLWQKGCSTEEEVEMYESNINDLLVYLEVLEERLAEVKNNCN
jgi:hypothetical protein